MAVTTYHPEIAATPAAATKAAGKGFWARVLERIVEARMRQVERELRVHLNYIPRAALEEAGYSSKQSAARELPFVK
jgi:hypothetical protein